MLALPGHGKHRRDPALFWNVSCGHSAHERIRLLPRNLPMAHADTLEPETTNTVFKAGAPRFAEVVLVEHQKRMCWPSGSEDTVGRPKNYQAKVPGTVSRTKRSANFGPQVKHFLGCKKSTKSNTCGSLFTCSGALLFSSTKTAKLQNPCISGHGSFACILYHVSTQEIHRQNLKRHRFSPSVLDNL